MPRPQGLGSPPNCLHRPSGNPLRHAWSSLSHFNGSISYPLPRKGGYPLQASLRRSGDRPDLSDLRWSSHWEAHAKLSGPSDMPVSSNISIIEHIYVFTHVNSTILRKCITQELSHNEALAHLLLPPGNKGSRNSLSNQLYILVKTCLLCLRINTQLTNSLPSPPAATTRQAAISSINIVPLLGYSNH